MRRVLVACLLLALLAPASAQAARRFPRHFLWGVATSGFQTEMGGRPDNRDPRTDWWVWTRDPANRADGVVSRDLPERGPAAWRRFRGDAKLARRLNLNAFRLGIEWSRIFPRPTFRARTLRQLDRLANRRAVRHYATVLRDLRRRRLEPFVTLNHYTLPTWIHDPIAAREALRGVAPDGPLPAWRGPRGWLDLRTPVEFGKYARYLGWKLGKLVRYWSPLNEPVALVTQGYVNAPTIASGNFPPGAFSFTAARQALLELIAANRVAYDALHREDRDARVGLVQNMIAFTPATPADARAARHAEYLYDRLFLDAAVRGSVDANADGTIAPSERHPRDARRADFIGVNYYFRGRVHGTGRALSRQIPVLDFVPSFSYRSRLDPLGSPCPTLCSDLGNEPYPEGFRTALAIAGSYRRPVYVTESGIADGTDRLRPDFLRSHLHVLQRAARARGADIRGYFHWSLMDNFEWAQGYAPKFGLADMGRRLRSSARILARAARTNAAP